MKIALASVKFINNNIEYNLAQIKKYMLISKEKQASLICFGESFLQGFDSLVWNYETDKNIAINKEAHIMNLLKKFTIEIGIDILIGYMELDKEAIYSSYILISNGLIIHNHRRIAKGWKDFSITDHHYKEGNSVEIVKYNNTNIVFALCGELWDYPEKFMLNADLLIWGIYCNFNELDWKIEEKEYAKHAGTIANKAVVINSISENPDSLGGTWYIENGKIKSKLGLNKEDVLIVNI